MLDCFREPSTAKQKTAVRSISKFTDFFAESFPLHYPLAKRSGMGDRIVVSSAYPAG
jgi:hypothetical protein